MSNPETEVEYRIKLHEKQLSIFNSTAKFQFAACGRRFGKNVVAWTKLLTKAMAKQGTYWWVASIYRELTPATETIREFTPKKFIVQKSERNNLIMYLKLPNGSDVYFHSGNTEDSLRGSKIRGCVIDEAGSFPENRWNEEIQPSLIDYDDSWMLAIGTPKKRNWFYTGYMKGQDREKYPDYESWQYSSYENTFEKGGFLNRKNIELIAGNLPELTRRQEIDAEFLTDEGSVFRPVYGGEYGAAEGGKRYVLGLDIARTLDWTVITAVDMNGQLRGMERFNQIDWETQLDKIKSFSKRFPGTIWLDATSMGGDQFYERMRKAQFHVRPFKFTGESKNKLVENLMLCFDEKRVTVPKIHPRFGEVMKNELESYTYTTTPTGRIQYNAPEGLHDDCVTSLALAAWGLFAKPSGYFI